MDRHHPTKFGEWSSGWIKCVGRLAFSSVAVNQNEENQHGDRDTKSNYGRQHIDEQFRNADTKHAVHPLEVGAK
jgi:hypothetical protein